MKHEDYPYDEDEFDVLGADRTPQGVHRAPVPRWRRVLPFLVVIVLAPALAWVGVNALSGNFGQDPEPPPPAATEEKEDPDGVGTDVDDDGEAGTEDDGEDPEGTDEEAAEDEDQATDDGEATDDDEAAENDLDRDMRIRVLNGSTTVGLAGDTAETLNQDGWTNTSTADYGYAEPTVTTVYYHDAQVADEAEAIADELGIAAVIESASASSEGVVIVLRQDFAGG